MTVRISLWPSRRQNMPKVLWENQCAGSKPLDGGKKLCSVSRVKLCAFKWIFPGLGDELIGK